MKLSDMRQILEHHGIQLTRSLGQNFLHDANQLRRIVAAAELNRSDKVLEIGPGLGPLTELLVAGAGEVLAIEKDARLVRVMRERVARGAWRVAGNLEREASAPSSSSSPAAPESDEGGSSIFAGSSDEATDRGRGRERGGGRAESIIPTFRPSTTPSPNPPPLSTFCFEPRTLSGLLSTFRLLHDDALDFLRREPRDWSDWKLVANLPYSVASPIVAELALAERGPERMVATLQIEVARRIQAAAGDPDYGVLSLLVQLNYEPRQFFKIPASCFFPEPDVDSACVCLVRRPRPLLPPGQQALFVKLVKRGFSQRRKMMRKLLLDDWPSERLDPAFDELKLSPQTRAEDVSLDQFLTLARMLGS